MPIDERFYLVNLSRTGKHNLDPVIRIRWAVIVSKLVQFAVYLKPEGVVVNADVHLHHVSVVHDHLDLLGIKRMLEKVRAMVLCKVNWTREAAFQPSNDHVDGRRLHQNSICLLHGYTPTTATGPIGSSVTGKLVRLLKLRCNVLGTLRYKLELVCQ